jgi:chorismate mutase
VRACSHVTRSPDEYPFTKDLPPPVLQPLAFPDILYPNDVNANAEILRFYTDDIVPRITRRATAQFAEIQRARGVPGGADDDGNYGSAATVDVEVLQAISKRVHYGAPLSPPHPL